MNFDPNNYNELTVTESPIPGLFVVKLPVHGDNRGWFKENYQKEKMEALGLPSFTIVQNNISFNDKAEYSARGAICAKAIASARFSRTKLILAQQFSYPKVLLMAIRHLTTTLPTPTWSTRTGRQMPNTPLSIYLTRHLVLTGQSAKSKRSFPKKTPLIHYLQM